MWVSGRACPGGSMALRTRCTRRSELVTVPSYSHQSAAAGSTTSAMSAVAVRKMSCTTRWSRPSSRCRAWVALASDSAGFSPMQYSARSVPALHGVEHLREVHARLRRDRHAPGCLVAGAGVVVAEVVAAGQLGRDGAHVAAALDVVLPAQRHQTGAVAPDVPGEQREVDQREDVVGGVVVLGDAQRPADLGAVGAARRRARARGSGPRRRR